MHFLYGIINEYPVPMEFVGIEDTVLESGDCEQLLEKYGLSIENIVKKVNDVLKKKTEK